MRLCLDQARAIAGVPFVLTSTLRDVNKNTEAGGVTNSAHLTGEAVDIHCPNSSSRMKMVNALLSVGFNRIGIGNTFVHADVSKTLPQNVIWHYY